MKNTKKCRKMSRKIDPMAETTFSENFKSILCISQVENLVFGEAYKKLCYKCVERSIKIK